MIQYKKRTQTLSRAWPFASCSPSSQKTASAIMQHTVPHSPTSPRTGTATNVSVPESPSRKSFLAMVGVVNFLGRARKTETIDGNKQLKPGHMIFVSGEPQTHPCVARCLEPEQLCKPVQFAESFVCAGGVNVVPLLVATRTTLLNRIGPLGANTLTDEQYVWFCFVFFHPPLMICFRWDVSISTLKAGIYKVQVLL